MPKVSIEELRSTCEKACQALGYSAEEAKCLVDVMMFSDLRGNTQGIIKIVTNGLDKDPNCEPYEIVKDTPLSAKIDGRKTVGMVVLHKAMQLAVEKAQKSGFGIVGTFNTFTSTGTLAYYGDYIARHNLIGLVFAGSPEMVAPFGACQPLFGTNPICFALPNGGNPVVGDLATSAQTLFGILQHKVAGTKLPPGCCVDPDGNFTDDPELALKGAILSFDKSFKGSALALMVEVFCTALAGGAIHDKKTAKSWGNLVIAIDPCLLWDSADEFKSRVDEVFGRVKSLKKMPGVNEIMLPGEPQEKVYVKTMAEGALNIEDNLWKKLQDKAAEAK